MTREEFSEAIEQIKEEMNCSSSSIGKCFECPLHCSNDIGCGNAEDIFDIIDDVEVWIKKHREAIMTKEDPIVTMRDKYKEVFGTEPKKEGE